MQNTEIIEKKILEVFFKLGLDTKLKKTPADVSLEFYQNDKPSLRGCHWYFKDDQIEVSAQDTDLESCLKTVSTRFAWLSAARTKYDVLMVLLLLLTLSPIFTWYLKIDMWIISFISTIILFTFPFVWYWAFNGSKLEVAEIKFKMMDTGVIFGEDKIDEYYETLPHKRWKNWIWVAILVVAELFNWVFSTLFLSGFVPN